MRWVHGRLWQLCAVDDGVRALSAIVCRRRGRRLDPISIATAPEPNATEFLTTAQFVRYNDATNAAGEPLSSQKPRCSTMLAPEGALLTVTNVDNGQSTTCTNTQGVSVPPGVGMVIGTDAFGKIGDLSDAPLPVRVRWDPDAPVDLPGELIVNESTATSVGN